MTCHILMTKSKLPKIYTVQILKNQLRIHKITSKK